VREIARESGSSPRIGYRTVVPTVCALHANTRIRRCTGGDMQFFDLFAACGTLRRWTGFADVPATGAAHSLVVADADSDRDAVTGLGGPAAFAPSWPNCWRRRSTSAS